MPAFKKTGTTIVGLVYKDGVVIAADQRATTDSLIVDKEVLKIHYIAPNIYCCGAGTAADADQITDLVSHQLALMRLQTGKQSRVVSAMTVLAERLFQYGGHISAALILGGCDIDGAHLYGIWPNGRYFILWNLYVVLILFLMIHWVLVPMLPCPFQNTDTDLIWK